MEIECGFHQSGILLVIELIAINIKKLPCQDKQGSFLSVTVIPTCNLSATKFTARAVR